MADADVYREVSYVICEGSVASVTDTELHFRDGTVCRIVRSKVEPSHTEEVCATGCAVDYERRVLEAKMYMTAWDAAFCGREDLIKPIE